MPRFAGAQQAEMLNFKVCPSGALGVSAAAAASLPTDCLVDGLLNNHLVWSAFEAFPMDVT